MLSVPVGTLHNSLGLYVQFVADGTVADEKHCTFSINIPWARGRPPVELRDGFACAAFLEFHGMAEEMKQDVMGCLLYTSPSPRDS